LVNTEEGREKQLAEAKQNTGSFGPCYQMNLNFSNIKSINYKLSAIKATNNNYHKKSGYSQG